MNLEDLLVKEERERDCARISLIKRELRNISSQNLGKNRALFGIPCAKCQMIAGRDNLDAPAPLGRVALAE